MFSIIFIENLEKTTVMGKKVLISEINSDVTETIFFQNCMQRNKYKQIQFCSS